MKQTVITILMAFFAISGYSQTAYSAMMLSENDYEMLLVINKFRPLTRDCASTLAVMTEIETACGMKFTGIVNNSNLASNLIPTATEYYRKIFGPPTPQIEYKE